MIEIQIVGVLIVNLAEVMSELESMGSEQTRKILSRHGAPANFFGVKVGDMKKIVKKVKKDQALALQLFETGNGDAMYLAALISDPQAFSELELDQWAHQSQWYMVTEYAVAGVAAEGPHGFEMGLKWIDSDKEHVACAGWSTLAGVVAHLEDDQLDLAAIDGLLDRAQSSLQESPNRVRYTMNGFVISVGCYIEALSKKAMAVAKHIGKVRVDMGETACKVPDAPAYIKKVIDMGRLGKKRKNIRC